MYNQGQYNTTQFNQIPVVFLDDLTTDDVRFNTFGFSQGGKIVLDQPVYDKPAKLVVGSYKKPLEDGYGENSQYMGIKKIELKGIIKVDSQTELEAMIDEINDELNVSFGNLDIKRADGSYRRFKAKASGIKDFRDKHFHTEWCDFSVDFEVFDGFGKDLSVTSSGQAVSTLAFDGSHICSTIGKKLRTPMDIIIAVNGATNITACNIKNNTTGDEIEFNVTLIAGDFLYLTTSETECYKVSGGVRTDIKPRGRYPILAKGSNNYTITFTGDAIDYNLTVKHINLYL